MIVVIVASVMAIRMGNRFGYVPLLAVVFFILIRLGYRYEWTGFGETTRPKTEKRDIQPRKTLWDWMQLLFVPAMLAVLVGGLTWWQTSSDRARQAEEVANQEALRAQNVALQAYFDQMTALVLQDELRGPQAEDVRTIAQARTSAVLQAVEPENQRTLLQFLSDARLIQKYDKDSPAISLDRADLTDSDLRNIDLRGANLRFANLGEANLLNANLSDANLSDADLSFANLHYTNLSGAALFDADLSDADMSRADLSGANLSGANLSDADLSRANLSEAKGWTMEQLTAGRSLEGATMPDGQTLKSDKVPHRPTFEEWLKGS